MLKHIVSLALNLRFYVIIAAVAISGYGIFVSRSLPIDVFPDMNRPVVSIMTEVHGFAPEEIEKLVTFHIESAMNGAPGAVRVRSTSSVGLSMVVVEFDWDRDLYLCRQVVQERLQLAMEKLPDGVQPILAPASSVTGEVLRMALTSDGTLSPSDLRTIADWEIRPRLINVKGVAQVFTIGGEVREFQIIVDPGSLARYQLTIKELENILHEVNRNTPGGSVFREGTELLVRNIGRIEKIEELENIVVKTGPHGSVRLKNLATVQEGVKLVRGTAGLGDQEAVIINVLKQPEANTLTLTKALEKEIDAIKLSLPPSVVLHDRVYRQARFIEAAVHNVIESVRDGSLLVIGIILVFLMSFRMSFIILTAIPLSVLTTLIVFSLFGLSVNTMTLGGIAVAIGELVDSAIVGAENIYRRLRENLSRPREQRKHFLPLIADATSEVFGGIILGTFVTLLVVIPLFALPGITGRIFSPIAVAYLLSNFTAMLVSITITPVICSYLLRRNLPEYGKDGWMVRKLKRVVEPIVLFSTRRYYLVLATGFLVVLLAILGLSGLGMDLLPEFNEGSVFVITLTPPGTDLDTSSRVARAAAQAMQVVPEIAASQTGHRSGRSEGDEHAHEISQSDIEAEIITPEGQRERSLEEIHQDLRAALAKVPGAVTELSQPIGHLISHLIGGARSQIIIKIFGPDLAVLEHLGMDVHEAIKSVPGVVDDHVEPQIQTLQLKIIPRDFELARYGISIGNLLTTLDLSLQGEVISQIQEGEKYYDLILRSHDYTKHTPETIGNLLISTPAGARIPLRDLADIHEDFGPNMINHENSRRRIFVLCNVAGRDLSSTVEDIHSQLNKLTFPPGYSWIVGGQYEQLIQSNRAIMGLFILTILVLLIVLAAEFRSVNLAMIILLNIPQALIGAVFALMVTGTALNMGALVGFVALSGIAARNGILLITHWITLIGSEGHSFSPQTLLLGCKERLTPVMMTALTTTLGLVPLILTQGQTGKEILYPVAVVIFGGLISSTLLDFTITPAATVAFGRKGVMRLASWKNHPVSEEHLLEEESLQIESAKIDNHKG